MLEEAYKRYGLILFSVLLWLVAFALCWIAVQQLTATLDLRAIVASARALQPQPITLAREPVSAADYARVAEAIKPYLAAGLKVEATPGYLSVSAERIEFQPQAMAALQEAMAAAADVQWVPESVCMGQDCRPQIGVKIKAFQNQVRQRR